MTTPPDSVSTTSLTMSYEGEEFTDSSILASDLAEVIRSSERLLERSNFITNGSNAALTLRVMSRPPSSFDFDLLVEVTNSALRLVPPAVRGAGYLRRLLVGDQDTLGLFGAFRSSRGHRPSNLDSDSGAIVLQDGSRRLDIYPEALDLLRDRDIHLSLHGLSAPLHGSRDNSLAIRDGTNELFTMAGSDIDTLEVQELGDVNLQEVDIPSQNLTVVAPNLRNRGARWQLSDGYRTNWYAILDEEFLQRVEETTIRFGTGDTLDCHVRIAEYTREDGSKKILHTILYVRSIRERGRQQQLF